MTLKNMTTDETTKAAGRRSEPLADAIRRYLLEHPDAQDTVEGIAEWWSREQRVRRSATAVRQGLAELVDQGTVLEQRGRDGRIHYKAKRLRAKTADMQPGRKEKEQKP